MAKLSIFSDYLWALEMACEHEEPVVKDQETPASPGMVT